MIPVPAIRRDERLNPSRSPPTRIDRPAQRPFVGAGQSRGPAHPPLLAALIALSIHRTMLRLLRRLLRDRHPYLRSFLAWTTVLTRVALLIFALFIALVRQRHSIARHDRDHIARIIAARRRSAQIGWAPNIPAVNMSADLYLRRFPARRRRQFWRVASHAGADAHRAGPRLIVVMLTLAIALMTFRAGAPIWRQPVCLGRGRRSRGRPGSPAGIDDLIAGFQFAMTQPIRIDDR